MPRRSKFVPYRPVPMRFQLPRDDVVAAITLATLPEMGGEPQPAPVPTSPPPPQPSPTPLPPVAAAAVAVAVERVGRWTEAERVEVSPHVIGIDGNLTASASALFNMVEKNQVMDITRCYVRIQK